MMKLRVWIDGSRPKIWRRLIADPRLTLEQLHLALQHAFGWTESHLHQFHEKNGRRYAIPTPFDDDFGTPAVDERKTLLADVLTRKKKAIAYEYDFGDSWIHIIEFEGWWIPKRPRQQSRAEAARPQGRGARLRASTARGAGRRRTAAACGATSACSSSKHCRLTQPRTLTRTTARRSSGSATGTPRALI